MKMAKVTLSIYLVAMTNAVPSILRSMFASREIFIVKFLNNSIGSSSWETIVPCNIIKLVEHTIIHSIERLW